MKQKKSKKPSQIDITRETFSKLFEYGYGYEHCHLINSKKVCWMWHIPPQDNICWGCPKVRLIIKREQKGHEQTLSGMKDYTPPKPKNYPKKKKVRNLR